MDVVDELVARLLSDGVGRNGIMIIVPYNAQVARLQARLESRGIHVAFE